MFILSYATIEPIDKKWGFQVWPHSAYGNYC